jgi:hypothetical protein
MIGKQVNELDALPSFTDDSLLPVHNGAGLKKGLLSQLANYLGTKFSNPNLLINPDFKINQRGSSTYTTTSESPIYTVDRWMLSRGKATVNSDKTVTITATGGTTNKEGYFQQKLENAISGPFTVSMEVVSISGTVRIAIDGEWKTVTSGKNVFQGVNSSNNFNSVGLQLAVGASITLKYMKLEQGIVATSFVAPNMAEELTKCYRFYQRMKSHFSGYVARFQITYFPIPIKAQTRTTGTITVSDQQDMYNITGASTAWSVGSDDYNKCPYIGFTTGLDGYARLICIVEIDAEIY